MTSIERELPSPFTICTFLPLSLRKLYTDISFCATGSRVPSVHLRSVSHACPCELLLGLFMLDLVVTVVSEELNIWHRFKAQHFFFFPAPPNLGLSLQKTQLPQSGHRQAGHFPHLFLLTPVFTSVNEPMTHQYMPNLYLWLRTGMCSF